MDEKTEIMKGKSLWLLPDHWHFLSGSWLKVLAMITMCLDHLAFFLFVNNAELSATLFTIGSQSVSWLFLMHCMGRMAFPLFCFLLVEGFLHTHDRRKYGRNLLVFALISEIPYDLVRWGMVIAPGQNVFFTLFLGYLSICAISWWEEVLESGIHSGPNYQNSILAVRLFSLIGVGVLINSDYGTCGISFIILLYVLRQHPILQAAAGFCMLPKRWIAGLAFIPISLYNGKRGFIKGPIAKYMFYLFYPIHLIVIYLFK